MASLQKIYDTIIKPKKSLKATTDLLYNTSYHNFNNLNIKHETIRHYISYCYMRKHDGSANFANIDANIKKICEIYATGLRISNQLANHIYYHYENRKPTKTTTLAITYQQISNNLEQIANILNAAVDNIEQTSSTNYLSLLLDDAKVHLLNQLDSFITLASNSFLGTRKRPCKRFEVFGNKHYFIQEQVA